MLNKIFIILFVGVIFGGTCFANSSEYSAEQINEYSQDIGENHSPMDSSEFGNENSQEDNMYSVLDEENPSNDLMDHSLGRSDFMASESTQNEVEQKMNREEGSHSSHIKKEIKISEHEWVSTSQKGYGSAAGITLVAGLIFGITVMRRS